MNVHTKALIVMIIVLISGQTIGIILRAIEDGFDWRRSLRTAYLMWYVYILYLLMPFILLYGFLRRKTRMGKRREQMTASEQFFAIFVILFLTYIFAIKDRKSKPNSSREYVFKRNSIRDRSSLRKLTDFVIEPVWSRINSAVKVRI